MMDLPEQIKAQIKAGMQTRYERIRFEELENRRAEVKLSLNYATLLVLEQGEEGLDFETIQESYGKHFDCPDTEIEEEVAEAVRKGLIEPHNPCIIRENTYYVSRRLWRELEYDC